MDIPSPEQFGTISIELEPGVTFELNPDTASAVVNEVGKTALFLGEYHENETYDYIAIDTGDANENGDPCLYFLHRDQIPGFDRVVAHMEGLGYKVEHNQKASPVARIALAHYFECSTREVDIEADLLGIDKSNP